MPFPSYFKAMLTEDNDKVIEYGIASISMQNRTIDFTSSFIPIIKMGTRVKIVKMCGEIPVQTFAGTVYLSTQKMLRLDADANEDLCEIEALFNINEDLIGTAKLFTIYENASYVNRATDIVVYSISYETLKFTCQQAFCIDQRIIVRINKPLDIDFDIVVSPQKIITLADNNKSYICKINILPQPAVEQLRQYALETGRFI